MSDQNNLVKVTVNGHGQASLIKGFTEITENKLFSGYQKSYFR